MLTVRNKSPLDEQTLKRMGEDGSLLYSACWEVDDEQLINYSFIPKSISGGSFIYRQDRIDISEKQILLANEFAVGWRIATLLCLPDEKLIVYWVMPRHKDVHTSLVCPIGR